MHALLHLAAFSRAFGVLHWLPAMFIKCNSFHSLPSLRATQWCGDKGDCGMDKRHKLTRSCVDRLQMAACDSIVGSTPTQTGVILTSFALAFLEGGFGGFLNYLAQSLSSFSLSPLERFTGVAMAVSKAPELPSTSDKLDLARVMPV